jgi:hypothetical protein
LNPPRRDEKSLAAGDRASDALLLGRAGQPIRAFELLKGPYWTLFGFNVSTVASIEGRRNLHIHRIGADGDLLDSTGAMELAYSLKPGDWVLVRPDGFKGATVLYALAGLMITFAVVSALFSLYDVHESGFGETLLCFSQCRC